MRILVVNCGSSSLKFKLYDLGSAATGTLLAEGVVEEIGREKSKFTYKTHKSAQQARAGGGGQGSHASRGRDEGRASAPGIRSLHRPDSSRRRRPSRGSRRREILGLGVGHARRARRHRRVHRHRAAAQSAQLGRHLGLRNHLSWPAAGGGVRHSLPPVHAAARVPLWLALRTIRQVPHPQVRLPRYLARIRRASLR